MELKGSEPWFKKHRILEDLRCYFSTKCRSKIFIVNDIVGKGQKPSVMIVVSCECYNIVKSAIK